MRIAASSLAALVLACGTPADFGFAPEPPAAPRPVTRVHDGLRYRAEFLLLREDVMEVQLTIQNREQAARVVTYADECVSLLRAYWAPAGGVMWDQRDGKRCRNESRTVTIPAGGTVTFPARASALTILGGEGSRRLEIAVYVRPLDSPELELALGVVSLSAP